MATIQTTREVNVATKTTVDKPAKSTAEAVEAIGKLPNQNATYESAAALLEAAAPGTAGSIGTQVRQIMRDAGKKVGRGKRYTGITPRTLVSQYKVNQAAKAGAKAAKSKAEATAKKPAKAKKAAKKEQPVAA